MSYIGVSFYLVILSTVLNNFICLCNICFLEQQGKSLKLFCWDGTLIFKYTTYIKPLKKKKNLNVLDVSLGRSGSYRSKVYQHNPIYRIDHSCKQLVQANELLYFSLPKTGSAELLKVVLYINRFLFKLQVIM